MPDLEKALYIAIAAAEAAEKILLKHFRKELHVSTKSSPRDLVTEVDREAQEAIIEIIVREFPDHGLITEEIVDTQHAGALKKNAHSHYQWIIDPLDGTTNFIHKKKEFATMIALWECPNAGNADAPLKDPTPLLGVIHQPLAQRRFEGIRGKGAFVTMGAGHAMPLHMRKTKNMLDAILCTNVVARGEPDAEGVLQVATPYCGSLHNYGCAAFEQGAILLGENDGVFYDGVGLWDIAAALLLIGEGGGKVRWEPNDTKDIRKEVRCVASTPPIFEELCKFLWHDAAR